jgi:SAM-dependent methyltransferase
MLPIFSRESSGVIPVLGTGGAPRSFDAYHRLTWRRERELLGRHGIFTGGAFCSVGCGAGVFEEMVGQTLAPRRFEAIDPDAWAVAEASSRVAGIRFGVGEATSLPWIDASFDVTFCRQLLWRLSAEERETAIAELLRVTKPGGVVYFLDDCSMPGEGEPDGRTIEQGFRLLSQLRADCGWEVEPGPAQAGSLRGQGLTDLKVDLMLVDAVDDPQAFADLVICWRIESFEMGLRAGWASDKMRLLDRGLRAFRQAALDGQAQWPVWVISGRKAL